MSSSHSLWGGTALGDVMDLKFKRMGRRKKWAYSGQNNLRIKNEEVALVNRRWDGKILSNIVLNKQIMGM